MTKRVNHFFAVWCCVMILEAIFMQGCSKQYYDAQREVNRGYKLYSKASEQTYNRQMYRSACEHYWKAYEIDKDYFGLEVIRDAFNSCDLAGDKAKSQVFETFSSEYQKTHPDAHKNRSPFVMLPIKNGNRYQKDKL